MSLLTTKEAAAYLGLTSSGLRNHLGATPGKLRPDGRRGARGTFTRVQPFGAGWCVCGREAVSAINLKELVAKLRDLSRKKARKRPSSPAPQLSLLGGA